MYPRYLFESGQSAYLTKEFYKWWKTYFVHSTLPVHDVKIRLVANTNRTLENFFIQKKPPRDMLARMEPISTTIT